MLKELKKGDKKKQIKKQEEKREEKEENEENEQDKDKEKEKEKEKGRIEIKFPPVSRLVVDNLSSSSSRHLMLLTKNCSALWLLFGCGMVERENTKVIIGSDFVEDKSELFIIQQLNEVKIQKKII